MESANLIASGCDEEDKFVAGLKVFSYAYKDIFMNEFDEFKENN